MDNEDYCEQGVCFIRYIMKTVAGKKLCYQHARDAGYSPGYCPDCEAEMWQYGQFKRQCDECRAKP